MKKWVPLDECVEKKISSPDMELISVGTWKFTPSEGFVGEFKALHRCTRDAVVTLFGKDGRFIRQSIGPVDAHIPYSVRVSFG